jgi:phosphatidylinositol kinase/protein kinase (PI-3  family)
MFVDTIASCDTSDEARQMIQRFLIEKCKKSISLSHGLFWLYTLAAHRNKELFFTVRSQLLQGLSKKMKKHVHSSYEYITMLKSCSRMTSENDIQKLLELNSRDCMNNIVTYPLNTEYMIIRNNYENIVRKQSTSKPIIIPVQCMHKMNYDTRHEKFLLKSDDVRQDAIIMDCIKIMDHILKQHEMDLHIVKYEILPITPNLGMVEIVQDALTIHEIQESNFSIQNYILEHNSTITVDDMRDRYTKSCAAYCLIGYLLGIGDRHLENIMITRKGFIFHIDFEFILGQDPKFIRPEIRITPSMIDAMGGFESKYYHRFQELCKEAFHCLRRHSAVFYKHLLLLSSTQPCINPNFTQAFIRAQVMKRFMVGESHANAELHFITKVVKSTSSSYKHRFVDLAHSSGQTLSSITENMLEYFGYSGKNE